MNCPKCGLSRALNDRVCPRCKYFFDEDRFINVELPRAGTAAPPSDPRQSRLRAMMSQFQGKRWIVLAASLVPGLGHAIAGRLRSGLFFFSLVAILVSMSAAFFSNTVGQMLFGLGVSAHAYSIFDLTVWSRSPDVRHRVVAMVAILGGLLLVYWPLLSFVANRLLSPRRGYRDRQGWLQMSPTTQFFVLVLFCGVSIWLWIRMSRMMSSKGGGPGA